MDQETRSTLETLLVAQVLTMAKTIEAEKRARGSMSTDHYIPEAIALIARERSQVLARLLQSP